MSSRDLFLRAVRLKNFEVVKFFIMRRGEICDDLVNIVDRFGWSALYIATRQGDVEIVDLLLDVPNININITTDSGSTPLHAAISGLHFLTMDKLLAMKDIDVNRRKTIDGNTPLHFAARYGNYEALQKLLSMKSIDVTIKNDKNETALDVAVDIESRSLLLSFIERRRNDNHVACPNCGHALTLTLA